MKQGLKSFLALTLALSWGLSAPIGMADSVEEVEGLPRYYEFFMKEGGSL